MRLVQFLMKQGRSLAADILLKPFRFLCRQGARNPADDGQKTSSRAANYLGLAGLAAGLFTMIGEPERSFRYTPVLLILAAMSYCYEAGQAHGHLIADKNTGGRSGSSRFRIRYVTYVALALSCAFVAEWLWVWLLH